MISTPLLAALSLAAPALTTVTSPGHQEYIFTVLVGRTQRSLLQNFEPQHRHLMAKIPGIQAMRDKYR